MTSKIDLEVTKGNRQYITFLDIEKAYDRVNRTLMWEVLAKIWCSGRIITIIKILYINAKYKYKMGDIQTDWVNITLGLRQGCILSPTLFTYKIHVKELIYRIKNLNTGINTGVEVLAILLYVDAIILVAKAREDMQRLLNETNGYAEDMKVKFSINKCQTIILNGEPEEEIALNNQQLRIVNKYKYLELEITINGLRETSRKKNT